MTRKILAHDPARRTNAQAIADLAELGFLRDTDQVLDLTIGPNAGFWKLWRTKGRFVTNDIDPEVQADWHWDVRQLPNGIRGGFDVVAWDPDYGYRGTSQLESDANYGLAGPYRSPQAVDDLLTDGALVAMKLARRLVLVKCQDQNVASHFRDQSGFVTEAARKAGGTVAAKLYVNAVRAQPAGKKQRNVWGYHSVLLAIEV